MPEFSRKRCNELESHLCQHGYSKHKVEVAVKLSGVASALMKQYDVFFRSNTAFRTCDSLLLLLFFNFTP